jgi:hypothetical protein
MSVFGKILNTIFQHGQGQPAPQPAGSLGAQAASTAEPAPSPMAQPSAPPASASPGQSAVPVDVGAVLETMAAASSNHGGNYKTSIVDLLNLLGLESSLSVRKQLAEELGVHAGADGSAEQNIALHRAVMDKLAANGGLVPDTLRQ